MNDLEDRAIVIMGGTSGIGLAAAQQLVARGAAVVVTGRNRDRAERVRQENPALRVEIVDASSIDALAAFYESLGIFDDLVLCVSGAKGAGPFQEVKIAELQEGFEEKFFTQFRAAQAAIPFLRKDGSLTFITAISARAANPGTSGLGMSKSIASFIWPDNFVYGEDGHLLRLQ